MTSTDIDRVSPGPRTTPRISKFVRVPLIEAFHSGSGGFVHSMKNSTVESVLFLATSGISTVSPGVAITVLYLGTIVSPSSGWAAADRSAVPNNTRAKIPAAPHALHATWRRSSTIASRTNSAESSPDSPRYSDTCGNATWTAKGIKAAESASVTTKRLALARKQSGIRTTKASRSQPR